MKRRAFTLVELMTVISILSILITIVVTSISGSMKSARAQRAEAACSMVQTGLATYYAQYDKWPEPLGSKVLSGSLSGQDYDDSDNYELSGAEVKQMVFELVKEAKNGNPMIDISVLYVSKNPGERGSKATGLDFFQAVHGTTEKEYNNRMSASQMYFGYPEKETGHFRRFRMVYSIPSDQLKVMQQ